MANTQPAVDGAAITTSDSANLARPCKGIYVGVTGDVKVDTLGSSGLVFKNAVQGSVIPVQATKVYATGTTATNLIALF